MALFVAGVPAFPLPILKESRPGQQRVGGGGGGERGVWGGFLLDP